MSTLDMICWVSLWWTLALVVGLIIRRKQFFSKPHNDMGTTEGVRK